MKAPNERYSTGLSFLDANIGGGLPVGKLLVLTAPAGSQSELLLHHMATEQPMQYISTTNPDEAEIRDSIERSAISTPVDLEFTHATASDLLDAPERYLDAISPESFVVVDPIDRLERSAFDQYLSFVNTLKRRLRETDSVGVFHGLQTDPVPDSRRLTLNRADHVWRVEQVVRSREIKTRLLVTKARGGKALSEPIPLGISDYVRVDTSRRIS